MDPASSERLMVVCIGASAGGLESLQALLPALPVDHGLCYVVLQHTAPKFRSMLAEILAKHTTMPVRDLCDGDAIAPDRVLVTPPNANVDCDGTHFRLSEPAPHVAPKPSINQFLMSLARHMGPRAAGIILSGTGSDGALGLRQLKGAGGAVLVQLPSSARYTGMPEAAIHTAQPDFILPPEQIGAALATLVAREADGSPPRVLVDADHLNELLLRVRRRCHIDFSEYKEGTLMRRIQRRIVARDVPDLKAYLALTAEEPAELDALMRDTLISVTSFFRDPQAFTALAATVEELLQTKPEGEPLRVWVPGCATGEEAYTVVIELLERMGPRLSGERLQVFATDVDLEALAVARHAVYPIAALDALPRDLVSRHFRLDGGQAEVLRGVREKVVFSRQDLTRDPPFPRLDLISCRNVLIYLKPSAQARILNAFRYALRPGGLLLLGLSEQVFEQDGAFVPLDRTQHLYRRSDLPTPLGFHKVELLAPGTREPARRQGPSLQSELELRLLRQAAARHVPPCVLLDEQWHVLQVHGDVSPFLTLQPGQQRLELLAMAQPWLQADLRALCLGALDAETARECSVSRPKGRSVQRWRLVLDPFSGSGRQRQSLLSFVPQAPRRSKGEQPLSTHDEAELSSMRERLRLAVEELESSNEEMQALNEEAQAANEELQASNEEMEAANEELQAANEELSTVNAELNHQFRRYRELSQELQTVQNSIDLPLLVVDQHFALRRFNEAAARLFHLREGSEGLPLSTIRLPDGLDDLSEHVARAVASASPLVVPLPVATDGTELVLHLSHHLVDGQRRGLVLTLVDNTRLARITRDRQRVEKRLLSMLTHGGAMFAIKDAAGRYEFVNGPYAAFFGLSADVMVGRLDAQCLPPAAAATLRRGDLALLQGSVPPEAEEGFDIGDRRRHWLATRFIIPDADGNIDALCVQAADITSVRAADERLRLADQVVAATAEGVMITDPDLRIVRVNPAFTQITGYSEAEALGQRPTLLASGQHDPHFYEAMWAQVRQAGHWRGQVWNKRRDQTLYLQRLSIDPMRDAGGEITHYVGVFSDITEIEQARSRIEEMATHDALTGLPNRVLLLDRLSHAIANARRTGGELAVCFIDLDHFKTVNDSLGHDAGDEMLRIAAQRILDSIRSADTLARLGGDEFVVLLENTTRHECLTSVQRLSRALACDCLIKGSTLTTGASIGIALYPHDGQQGPTLMRNADAAMYRAKAAGRGSYAFFSPEVGESAHSRLGVESGLRHAVGAGELWLAYQAQFDLQTLELTGVEALLRWQPLNQEPVPPTVFLPVAEESTLIESLGEWVLDHALAQLSQWRGSGRPDLSMSINLSPRQLRNPRLVDKVQDSLVRHRLPAEALTLEVTESAVLADERDAHQNPGIATLHRLRDLGCRISLDDFGTGHSSLTRLRELPLDELKIDRSFVRGLGTSRSDGRIATAVIELAQALGLRIVAEGIETEVQLGHLRGVREDLHGQGFLVAKPVSADDFATWLRERDLLHLSCRLDRDDRIVQFEGPWQAMAAANHGELQAPPVGRPLHEFVQGEDTVQLLRQALAEVRSTGQTRLLPYRCDSDHMRRDMEMVITPVGDGHVQVEHRLLRLSPLARRLQVGFDAGAGIVRCSQCLSLRLAGGHDWIRPEQQKAAALGAAGDGLLVRYEVCPNCTKLAAPGIPGQ